MLLSRRLSLSNLCEMCQTMRHYIHAGITLRDALRALARKSPRAIRDVSGRLTEKLDKGENFEDALKPEQKAFPPLFISMVAVGEKTGMLPEVLGDLEKYYVRQLKLRRDFFATIAGPIIQFVVATLVLAGLIYVLGLIGFEGGGPGQKHFDPLGLGLLGGSGALIFLGVIYGTLTGVAVLYFVGRYVLRQGLLDNLLLKVWVLGPCLQAIALARFCMALRLTMETSMSIGHALRLSLRGTGNSAYAAKVQAVQQSVRRGDDLVMALGETRLFPEMFMGALAVGEESGQVTDVMRRLADEYHDEAGRRLAVLSGVAAYTVWFMVAAAIVTAVLRIAFTYIALIEGGLKP